MPIRHSFPVTKDRFLKVTLAIAALSLVLLFAGCANEAVESPPDPAYAPTAQPLPQESEILDASARGNTARVQQLLSDGVSVNAKGPQDNTPIMEAAYGGHLDTVKLLLDHGADLSARKRDGASAPTLTDKKVLVDLFKDVAALVAAATAGDDKTINALLDKGTPINGLDQAGESALHAACWNGRTETVRLLLERGANPQIRKRDGASPLTLARGQKHDEIVVLLNEAVRKQADARSPASGTAR